MDFSFTESPASRPPSRDARQATGRDAYGLLPHDAASPSWLGAVGYLCFIDQVGSAIYRQSRGRPRARTDFHCGLKSFSHLHRTASDVCDVLYSLRCSLAHDYSLLNKQQRHLFALTGGPGMTPSSWGRRPNGTGT